MSPDRMRFPWERITIDSPFPISYNSIRKSEEKTWEISRRNLNREWEKIRKQHPEVASFIDSHRSLGQQWLMFVHGAVFAYVALAEESSARGGKLPKVDRDVQYYPVDEDERRNIMESEPEMKRFLQLRLDRLDRDYMRYFSSGAIETIVLFKRNAELKRLQSIQNFPQV